MKKISSQSLFKFSVLAVAVALAGCAQVNKAPTKPMTRTMVLKQTHKVMIYGPYQAKVILGAKKPHMVLSSQNGSLLNDTLVYKHGDSLRVVPTRAASAADISHTKLLIYVNNLRALKIIEANGLRVFSKPHSNFSLLVKDSKNVSVTGGAVIPYLYMNDNSNFRIDGGKLYLSRVHFYGGGTAYLKGIRGGKLSIDATGPGYLYMKGAFTLWAFHHDGMVNFDFTGGPIQANNFTFHTDGHRAINMHGINFKSLTVNGYGTDRFNLSGYVGNLKANMTDSSKLNGFGLTTRNAEIKTYDNSVVHLYSSHRVFANSYDTSRIEFTGKPKYRYMHAMDGSANLPVTPPQPNTINQGDYSF